MNQDAAAPTTRAVAAGLVLLALLAVPAPLLPPLWLAETVQSLLGVSWSAAYFVTAIGLQSAFYLPLGALATLALRRAPTRGAGFRQVALTPWVVVGLAIVIRSLKAGYWPAWTNAIVPIIACLAGVALGFGLLYRRARATMAVAALLCAAALWGWRAGHSSSLQRATEQRLRRLAAVDTLLPTGDARLALLLETAFAALPVDAASSSAQDNNRAAILALGIAVGDGRLARQVGLERDTALVRRAVRAGSGATLRGRSDWAQHFTVSAALAVLEHPLVSDAAGLMKEQLDALTRGSGFSFGDLAADRAGVRFAAVAVGSQDAALATQARLRGGAVPADFFPEVADLPENLTVEQFRRDYGGVGSPRYREQLAAIEARLDNCPGLEPAASRHPVAHFAQVNGVRLQYLDWGGSGTGLVFIHGLGDSPHAFDEIAPAFRGRFRVIAYARRAHGRSEARGPYDHATLVEDLRQLLDTVGIRRAVLVGWSIGGNELSEFAARYPGRTAGLVYLECYDYGSPQFTRMLAHFPISSTPGPGDLASRDAFRSWWKSASTPNGPLTPAMEAEIADLTDAGKGGTVRLVTTDSIGTALFTSAMTYHTPYAAIRAPILAIWGHWYRGGLLGASAPDSLQRRVDAFLRDHGHPMQDSTMARIRAAAPGARLVMLDRANHAIFPFQNRDTIIAEMRRFLGALPSGPER